MVRCCCVPYCGNHSAKRASVGITYHKFPVDETRRNTWVKNVNRGNSWKPHVHSFVCSAHFLPEDFDPPTEFGRKTNLTRIAVPTLFPDAKSCIGVRRSKAKPSSSYKIPTWSEKKVKRRELLRIADDNDNDDDAAEKEFQVAEEVSCTPDFVDNFGGASMSLVNEISGGQDLKQENAELKQTVSSGQLKILKLQFENKVLRKERDEFEDLLTDAESKLFEAEKVQTDFRKLLSRSFKSVEEVKKSIRKILTENSFDFETTKGKRPRKPKMQI